VRLSSGATLNLASQCTYLLYQGLPAVSHDLTINGRGATLERSHARGTAPFTILTVYSGALVIRHLSFRNGHRAITDTGTGLLTVAGGTFSGNSATDGGAIYLDNVINGPQLTGVTFSGNSATDSGGAVSVNAASADPSIDHCARLICQQGNFRARRAGDTQPRRAPDGPPQSPARSRTPASTFCRRSPGPDRARRWGLTMPVPGGGGASGRRGRPSRTAGGGRQGPGEPWR